MIKNKKIACSIKMQKISQTKADFHTIIRFKGQFALPQKISSNNITNPEVILKCAQENLACFQQIFII